MKNIFRFLKYAGIAVIILEAVKTVAEKVANEYPELLKGGEDATKS